MNTWFAKSESFICDQFIGGETVVQFYHIHIISCDACVNIHTPNIINLSIW